MRCFKTTCLLLLMLTGFFDRSHGQYLNREYYPLWANEDYENYAHFSYRDIRLRR